MILVALAAALQGGYYFAMLVAAAATAMFYEWSRIVRGWGAGWDVGGLLYCLLPALALLWMRDRAATTAWRIVLWVFIVTWATDIGAYFVGRSLRPAQARSGDQPRQDRRGAVRRHGGGGPAWRGWALLTGLHYALLILLRRCSRLRRRPATCSKAG